MQRPHSSRYSVIYPFLLIKPKAKQVFFFVGLNHRVAIYLLLAIVAVKYRVRCCGLIESEYRHWSQQPFFTHFSLSLPLSLAISSSLSLSWVSAQYQVVDTNTSGFRCKFGSDCAHKICQIKHLWQDWQIHTVIMPTVLDFV